MTATSVLELTTGPLGQGIAMSVGMAIARRWLAARYDRPGFALFDYDVYAICGDMRTMPGLSSHPNAERIDLVDGEIRGLS